MRQASKVHRRFRNPFYAVLVLAGTFFCINAFAYGVLTVHALSGGNQQDISAGGRWLLQVLDQYGFHAMMIELAILALDTVGAILTDDYWDRQR